MSVYIALLFLLVSCGALPSNKFDVSPPQTVDELEILRYWTAERLSSAKPKERLPSKTGANETKLESGPNGPQVAIEGFMPSSSLNNSLLGGPVDPTQYPYTVVGRLAFTQAGTNYWAAAVAIQANTILTSGDSVFDFGVWSTNAVFYPSYPRNTTIFVLKTLYAYTGWTQNYLEQYNYGLATTTTQNAFRPIGWAGTKWNAPLVSGLSWTQVGYSSVSPSTMYQSIGSIVLPQPIYWAGTQTINNADGMSIGNSWWDVISSTTFYANGVTTFGFTSYPSYRYSPYFDTAFGELYAYVVANQ